MPKHVTLPQLIATLGQTYPVLLNDQQWVMSNNALYYALAATTTRVNAIEQRNLGTNTSTRLPYDIQLNSAVVAAVTDPANIWTLGELLNPTAAAVTDVMQMDSLVDDYWVYTFRRFFSDPTTFGWVRSIKA